MAAPAQIQVRYVQEEDRILLRMTSTAAEEYRFWLTRRFLLRLWPVLQEALLSSPTVKRFSDLPSQHAMLAFEHEQAQSKAAFNQPFRSQETLPLGEEPLLVVKAGFRHLDGGGLQIAFKDVQENGIDLTLSHDVLHLLSKLLDDAATQSEWQFSKLLPNLAETAVPLAAHQLN